MSLSKIVKYTAIAGALTTPLALAIPAASAGTAGTGSAYGLAASGLVTLPPTPMVHATDHKSVFSTPPNPLIHLSVLKAAAKPGHARASVVDLRLVKSARVLSAHIITARCDNGRGSSDLVRASLAGHKLAAHASPNTTLSIPVQGVGTASVTLNKQVRDANGGLTVTALEVSLALVTGQSLTVDVSSASCSAGSSTPSTPPSATPSPSPSAPGEAPKPTPVPSNLPVTG